MENVGRLTGLDEQGRPFEAENIGRVELTIDIPDAEAVRNGSRTSAAQAEDRGFDSRPPLQVLSFGGSDAGRHGNHVRWHRPDPACAACIAANRSDPIDIDDDRTSFVVDSPSDLPLSYAVLHRKYSRGGRRNGRVSRPVVARIRAVMACRDPAHDDAWCAAILDTARGNAVASLESAHALEHAPPAPDPDVVAEAAEADRRRQAYVLRQQLENGVDDVGRPLGELARSVVQRQLTRLEAPQSPQGP